MRIIACLGLAMLCLSLRTYGQSDSGLMRIAQIPGRFFNKLNNKASSLDNALTRQTEKYLQCLEKKEKKIQARLLKLDSNMAKSLFTGSQSKYNSLKNSMNITDSSDRGSTSGEYMPYADSMKTALAFAQKNPALLNLSAKEQKEAAGAMAQYNKLQSNLANADKVKEYIRQRKQLLKDQLSSYIQNSSIKKYIDQYNSASYYYSQQVREFKESLNDPDKMMQKALIILNKIPAFSKFIQQNGQLAGLFGIPANYGSSAGVEGLQTTEQVQKLLQGTMSTGGSSGISAMESSLETAHQQIDQFKDKLSSLGSGCGDIDMPNFKPNDQKTKTFLKRLELGVNLQTTRSNGYFPSTTDIGFSLGYKITNKTTIGLGGSYNIGWGSSIQHVHFTSQGASVRSFIDINIKKTFYISGGFEANYVTPFTSFMQLAITSMWQRAGLIGFSKMVSLPGKIVKKTKISLLWNFLSHYEQPTTQAILFRVGYNF